MSPQTINDGLVNTVNSTRNYRTRKPAGENCRADNTTPAGNRLPMMTFKRTRLSVFDRRTAIKQSISNGGVA